MEPEIESPLVSIVIACYNHEHFVQDSIQSVINQTYTNIELIIIDDGSTDNSVSRIQQMVESCEKRFVRFEFRSRLNKGLSATLNEALEWCQGEYYSPFASDDLMNKDKTDVQVAFLEKNISTVAVFGGVIMIDNNGSFLTKILGKYRQYTFEEIIMHEHDLPAPTQMIRLAIIKELGGYDSRLLIEDWYMWLKLSKYGNICYINHVLCLYRQHDSNISKNLVRMQEGRLEVLECFNDHPYYKIALKNTKWINLVETYVSDKNYKYVFRLLVMQPKKTIKIIFKNLKNKVVSIC